MGRARWPAIALTLGAIVLAQVRCLPWFSLRCCSHFPRVAAIVAAYSLGFVSVVSRLTASLRWDGSGVGGSGGGGVSTWCRQWASAWASSASSTPVSSPSLSRLRDCSGVGHCALFWSFFGCHLPISGGGVSSVPLHPSARSLPARGARFDVSGGGGCGPGGIDGDDDVGEEVVRPSSGPAGGVACEGPLAFRPGGPSLPSGGPFDWVWGNGIGWEGLGDRGNPFLGCPSSPGGEWDPSSSTGPGIVGTFGLLLGGLPSCRGRPFGNGPRAVVVRALSASRGCAPGLETWDSGDCRPVSLGPNVWVCSFAGRPRSSRPSGHCGAAGHVRPAQRDVGLSQNGHWWRKVHGSLSHGFPDCERRFALMQHLLALHASRRRRCSAAASPSCSAPCSACIACSRAPPAAAMAGGIAFGGASRE